MADSKKITSAALALLLLTAPLSGCLKTQTSKPGETAGVSRVDIVPETEPEDTTLPPLDNQPESETAAPPTNDGAGRTPDPSSTGSSYRIDENGKYVYTMAAPDRSSLDTNAMRSVSRALFSDQGDDPTASWYFGKTTYDETTGTVTYVWDRSADTLALLDQYGGIYRRHTDEKVCYLTFDCGYENGYTDPILDTLKEKNVPAIFFVTGQFVDTAGDQIRRMINEGHLIGNHTEHHKNPTTLEPEDFIDEIESVENKMYSLYNYSPMLYWRPPQGACNEYVLNMAHEMGLRTTLWSFTQYDYDVDNQPEYSAALQKAKDALHPGAVYLLHATSKTNSEILGELIDWIRAQGYELRPICDD